MTALPEQPPLIEAPAEVEAVESESKPAVVRVKVGAARESQGCRDIYFRATGIPYRDHAKDAVVWKSLRKQHSVADIEERWRVALVATGWSHCDNIWQLGTKWNELGALTAKSKPVEDVLPDCEACGARGKTSSKFCRLWLCSACHRAADVVASKVPAPKGVRLGDTRVDDYQRAMDAAVSTWAKSTTGGER